MYLLPQDPHTYVHIYIQTYRQSDRQTGGRDVHPSIHPCMHGSAHAKQTDLSGEDHVDALVLDILGKLPQECEHVRHLGAPRQVPQADAVAPRASCDEVLRQEGGQRCRGELGEEGRGQLGVRGLLGVPRIHASVQHLQVRGFQ